MRKNNNPRLTLRRSVLALAVAIASLRHERAWYAGAFYSLAALAVCCAVIPLARALRWPVDARTAQAAHLGLASLTPWLVFAWTVAPRIDRDGDGGGALGGSALVQSSILLPLVLPATLAVLLSIDTLKTCVVLDALTRSRHNSNRELIGQGLANLSSGAIGGIPGAGTMGATLVNVSGGASTSFSGLVEGVLSLLVFLLLTGLISWVPVSALAGILIVVGVRIIDRNSLHFLKSRSTILDFAVIVAVIGTALTVSLIAASGVGVIPVPSQVGQAPRCVLKEKCCGVRRSMT